MKNYITETDLKAFVPALTKFLWKDEADFSKQKEKAELIVNNDFISRGYNLAFLQVPLVLRESEAITADETTSAVEDEINRLRYVYSVLTYSGTAKTVVLKGCNTEDGTYETCNTFTISATATDTTGVIGGVFKYYKLVSTVTGTLDFTFKLVETHYDLFYAYKWLELILMDAYKEEGDSYFNKMLEFRNMYNDLWNNTTVNEDTNEDGEVDEDEAQPRIIIAP